MNVNTFLNRLSVSTEKAVFIYSPNTTVNHITTIKAKTAQIFHLAQGGTGQSFTRQVAVLYMQRKTFPEGCSVNKSVQAVTFTFTY